MSKNNSHLDDSPQKAANQNNQTSEDPRDGHRLTDNPERGGETALEQRPEQDRQDRETIEAFGRPGVATTDKEA